MENLISILEQLGDIDWVIAELRACDRELETIDELAEYLEEEFSYAN